LKDLKKWRRKAKSRTLLRSADRPEFEFKVACDVIEFGKFDKICGLYDGTGNFELNLRAIS